MIEKQYDQSSDLWSVGCIMYELLQYLQHTNPATFKEEFRNKRYAFQGDSCFPLSPFQKDKKKSEKKNVISKND